MAEIQGESPHNLQRMKPLRYKTKKRKSHQEDGQAADTIDVKAKPDRLLAKLISEEFYFTALGALAEALCNEGLPRSSHQAGWHEVPLGIQVEEVIVDRAVQGDDGG